MPPPPEKRGFRLYREVLKDPKHVIAPMVDASELAWRMLGRKYGSHLCYTPMWHSAVFVRDEKYRKNIVNQINQIQLDKDFNPILYNNCKKSSPSYLLNYYTHLLLGIFFLSVNKIEKMTN